MILATELLGFDADKWALFNIAIQPGAILAIVVLYWRTFWDVLIGLYKREPERLAVRPQPAGRLLPAVVLGLALRRLYRIAARQCGGRRLGADRRRRRDPGRRAVARPTDCGGVANVTLQHSIGSAWSNAWR